MTEKADKGFYELVIADVLPQDAGKYSCTASNKYGEVSCEATVTVTSKYNTQNKILKLWILRYFI